MDLASLSGEVKEIKGASTPLSVAMFASDILSLSLARGELCMLHMIGNVVGPVLSVLGAIVIGGGTITMFAYGLFKLFSEKWLANKFAEKLESFKHEHQKELQRLRLEIDSLLDRNLKLHSREFEVLPQAWSMLDDAFREMLTASMAYLQIPDLDRMSEPQLTHFLLQLTWPDWQKDELRLASDKRRYYGDVAQWRNLQDANRHRGEFQSYLSKNGIFIQPALLSKFHELNVMMIGAFVEREMAMQSTGVPQKYDKAVELSNRGKILFDQLQIDVQTRLWSSMKVGAGAPLSE